MAQSGVSLVAADGETLTGGVQSNFAGNGFYTRNGFTRAANWSGGDFTGFDDPSFLPICTWLTDFSGTGFYARMDDLGLNGMLPAAGSITLANNVTYGKWAAVPEDVHAAGTISTGDDPGVVGVSTGEEPSTAAEYEAHIDDADAWLASADGPGRFHVHNFADNLMNGDIQNVYYPDDMVIGAQASPNVGHNPHPFTTCDQYWFSGAPNNAGGTRNKVNFRLYTQEGVATETECARGSHYGSMLDSIRKAYTLPSSPFGVWIENGAAYSEAESAAITPAQLKWAVWSTLVHGARSIHYFNHTFRTGEYSSNNFADDTYGGPGVAGTGIYAAAKEVNLRALQIAPAVNGPFDGYFVYGDGITGAISTTGFLTAVTSTNTRAPFAGVDASCKWNPQDSTHYILATTREPGSVTNVPITCRMVDQGQTTATPVFGGSALTVTRGGSIPDGFCEFTDTFATAAEYKCWRIDAGDPDPDPDPDPDEATAGSRILTVPADNRCSTVTAESRVLTVPQEA
jgi:hypothetical protein